MNQFLKTESDIKSWLDCMEITQYKLLPDPHYGFVVDVNQSVNISNKNLCTFPVKFNKIRDHFLCNKNKLTSLWGAPQSVGGNFYCDSNQLTSLEGAPQRVEGSFNCTDNLLINLQFFPSSLGLNFICDNNRITSLLGSPNEIKGIFSCSHNLLQSLKHASLTVRHHFWCDHNQILDLLHCPQRVEGSFFCDNNVNLGNAQQTTNFSKILQIHLETKRIRDEKEQISASLDSLSLHRKIHHKI